MLNSVITLDFVAKRYGYLPSQILESGNTLDLYVAEVAVGYENYMHKKASNKQNNQISSNYSTEELQQMLNRVKNESKAGKK